LRYGPETKSNSRRHGRQSNHRWLEIHRRGFVAGDLWQQRSQHVILFEDGAALAGLLIAFLGLLFAHILQKPSVDTFASIGIALILMIAAALLGNEARGLLRVRAKQR
jgi:hypothetical protein